MRTIDSDEAFRLIDTLLSRFESRMREETIDAFAGMRERESLSEKQRKWVQDEAIRFELLDDSSQNLWSNRSPAEQQRIRGREVPTPAVLLNRPLTPPGRGR